MPEVGSGDLFVFELLLLWLLFMSLPYLSLRAIATNDQGFLGFMRVLGWFNKHQCTHTRATKRTVKPYTFTHARATNGQEFFFFFFAPCDSLD